MRLPLLLSCALSALAWGASASAQIPEEDIEAVPIDAAEESYGRHMDNGVKLYKEEAWEAAIAEFDAAYRAKPRASPLVNQALCYKKLRRYAEAIAVLERAVGEHEDSLEPRHKEAAEKEIEELRALIAWLTVKLLPPEASLTVDGVRVDAAGPLPLAPGPHELRAEAEGYEPVDRRVTLVSGRENPEVSLELVPVAGEVEVRAASAEAWIEIDGKQLAQGRYQGKLGSGLHVVRVYRGEQSSTLSIVVLAGKRAIVTQAADGALDSPNKAPGDGSTKPPAEPPSYFGFYLLASAAMLTVPNRPIGFVRNDKAQGGFAIGGGAGLRVARWAAFELFGQYNDVRINGQFEGQPDGQFVFRGGRGGGALRVMIPGDKWIRFAGILGGGACFEELAFRNAPAQSAALYQNTSGIGVFGQLDLALEIELNKILISLGAQHTAQSSKHLTIEPATTNAFEENPVLFVGPKVQIGYAFW